MVVCSPYFYHIKPSTNPSEQLCKGRRGEKHHKAKGNDHRLAWLFWEVIQHNHSMRLPNQCVFGGASAKKMKCKYIERYLSIYIERERENVCIYV